VKFVWTEEYKRKLIKAEDVAELISPGDRIICGHANAWPGKIMEAIAKVPQNIKPIIVSHARVEDELGYLEDKGKGGQFFLNALMLGPTSRRAMTEGVADFIPNKLSLVPKLINEKLNFEKVILHLSPPDKYGFCSFGTCVSYLPAALKKAKKVIAQINEFMPTTFGTHVHISVLDYIVEYNQEVGESYPVSISNIEQDIGNYVCELIGDCSTLQLGIGSIPNAVLKAILDNNIKDLGIHSEMISDGIVDLFEAGNINCSKKTIDPGKIIVTFVMGTKKLYEFIHRNPFIEFRPADYTNDPFVIAQNDKLIAINSALQVDITGQINAESIGTSLYTGTGGQLDFASGAAKSRGGKFIIAMPSTALGGKVSRIVPTFDPGTTVTTPRSLADYIITEYGIASLKGENLAQRAKKLIRIAHPDFRDWLKHEAEKRNENYERISEGKKLHQFNKILYQKEESIGVVLLNRPEIKNAIDFEMYKEIGAAIDLAENDPDVRVVIITGNEKTFSSGGDVAAMVNMSSWEAFNLSKVAHDVLIKIEHSLKPTIAAINGYAFGGGFELALACDLLVVDENSKMGLLEINLGIIPGSGGIQRLTRLIGLPQARKLLFTGQIIEAEEARKFGLIAEVAPKGETLNVAKVLAQKIIAKGPIATYFTKLALNEGLRQNMSAALAIERNFFALLFSTEDQKEGMRAFLEKRHPNYTGQ